MGWRDAWYPTVVSAMRTLRGDGATGTDGVIMPRLTASDSIPFLSLIAPGLINTLKRATVSNGVHRSQAIKSELVDDDGVVYLDDNLSGVADPSSYISIEQYVSGIGFATDTARRELETGGQDYSLFLYHNAITGDEAEFLGFCRQAVRSWQRAVDAGAVMLASAVYASDTSNTLAVSTFLSAVRSLCADLDVLRENPPLSTMDKVKGAARDALVATEQFAGKAAAQVSEEVGKLAGNVAAGFFSQAGIVALVVSGLAVYIMVK